MRILLIDNYDSFTYILKHDLQQQGDDVVVKRNDDVYLQSAELSNEFQAVVLSPGPGRPEESGFLMSFVDAYIQKLPILGICLGHQAIGAYFGAKLIHAQRPMHGQKNQIRHSSHPLFKGIPESFFAGRYHSLVLETSSFPNTLDIIAQSGEGEIMALAHPTLPVCGIQFHPESCMTEEGKKITGNWLTQIAGHSK